MISCDGRRIRNGRIKLVECRFMVEPCGQSIATLSFRSLAGDESDRLFEGGDMAGYNSYP